MQKTRLEVVLPPELVPTLRALIASTPLMSLPLFCLPTPLAIAGPCLLSCPNVADKTLWYLRCLELRAAFRSCGQAPCFAACPNY